MLSLLGLVLTFIGGAIGLIPQVPHWFTRLQHLPPFSKIRKAEHTLYHEGEIRKEHSGFDELIEALMHNSQPYYGSSEYGCFRDYSFKFPTNDGSVSIDFGDCRPYKIKKVDEGRLDTSVFSVWMIPGENIPKFNSLRSVGEDEIPGIQTELPEGRVPEIIKVYKRTITAKYGLVLMFVGVVIGVAGHLV